MLTYPGFNPIAFELGPVKVHWYGIMYLLGFAGGLVARRGAARPRPGSTWKPVDVDDLIFFAHARRDPRRPHRLRAVLRPEVLWRGDLLVPAEDLGGRHVLPRRDCSGCVAALSLFAWRRAPQRRRRLSTSPRRCRRSGCSSGASATSSTASCGARPPTVPWGFRVERRQVRHPSQLYEAALEGLVLFIVLWWFTAQAAPAARPLGPVPAGLRPGALRWWSSCACRMSTSATWPAAGSPMGQLLSLPMIVAGAALLRMRLTASASPRATSVPRA